MTLQYKMRKNIPPHPLVKKSVKTRRPRRSRQPGQTRRRVVETKDAIAGIAAGSSAFAILVFLCTRRNAKRRAAGVQQIYYAAQAADLFHTYRTALDTLVCSPERTCDDRTHSLVLDEGKEYSRERCETTAAKCSELCQLALNF